MLLLPEPSIHGSVNLLVVSRTILVVFCLLAVVITFCLFWCTTSTFTVMSTEQDLVKGKDTMVPVIDFQEKKRTGWRQLKIPSSGVV